LKIRRFSGRQKASAFLACGVCESTHFCDAKKENLNSLRNEYFWRPKNYNFLGHPQHKCCGFLFQA